VIAFFTGALVATFLVAAGLAAGLAAGFLAVEVVVFVATLVAGFFAGTALAFVAGALFLVVDGLTETLVLVLVPFLAAGLDTVFDAFLVAVLGTALLLVRADGAALAGFLAATTVLDTGFLFSFASSWRALLGGSLTFPDNPFGSTKSPVSAPRVIALLMLVVTALLISSL